MMLRKLLCMRKGIQLRNERLYICISHLNLSIIHLFNISRVGLGNIEIMHSDYCSKRHCDYCYITLEHFAVVNRAENHTTSVAIMSKYYNN